MSAETLDPQVREAIEQFVRREAGAQQVRIEEAKRLSGGAIQENWALTASVSSGPYAGSHRWVLRTDAQSAVAASLSRSAEFAVLQVSYAAGVRVPKPLWLCRDRSATGREFFIMTFAAGTASAHRLTRESALVPEPRLLAHDLGANLARLHAIAPPCAALPFLSVPQRSPALEAIAGYRAYLDSLAERFLALEWGLRWCEIHAPKEWTLRLTHRDYRTGNYLVQDGRLSAVLDWEFAAWGDPDEDIGWFTARCWRFAQPGNEAGGIGKLEDFLAGYATVADLEIDASSLRYWQVMAHLRWAIIALQQAQRHDSGQQRSLELALTGTLVPELSLEIMRLIERSLHE
ncbi:phosphotransferase family protein [Burkholderia sp. R-69980]|nr:phosphotransferase family protein [Burkholderia sp. R-69980]